jgi:hypothetical protein
MQEAANWELLRQYVQANDDANGGTPSAARETHALWPWHFQAGWTEAGSTLFSTLFHFGEMCVNRVVIIVWAIASHGRSRGSGRNGAALAWAATAALARMERAYEKPATAFAREVRVWSGGE